MSSFHPATQEDGCSHKLKPAFLSFLFFKFKPISVLTSSGRLSVPMEMRELYSCSRSCLACRREVMKSSEIRVDTFSGRVRDVWHSLIHV